MGGSRPTLALRDLLLVEVEILRVRPRDATKKLAHYGSALRESYAAPGRILLEHFVHESDARC